MNHYTVITLHHKMNQILHAQTIPDDSPQFDVSFPGQLPKIVPTRGEIFQAEIHQIPFGGRAPPAPAGGAKALPQTP